MRYSSLLALTLSFAMAGAAMAQPLAQGLPKDKTKIPGLEVLVEHADSLKPYARTETGEAFLDAVRSLPNQLRRYLWVDRPFANAYTEAEYNSLDAKAKRGLSFRPVTELAYYTGISERPLMDVMALDLGVIGTEMSTPEGLVGKKILLFNPRVITQGRLLASLGADVTIVHDQQRMRGLYSERGDVVLAKGHGDHPAGKLRLISSTWPGSGATEIGSGYDLVIVSDWVSRGLTLPTTPPPRWISVNRALRPLPCTLEEFAEGIASVLAPSGRFVCYAYGPIQPRLVNHTMPYSDVRFPVGAETIASAGLEILALDADDTRNLQRAMLSTGYNEPMVRPDDGVPSMTSSYTILVKP